MGIVSIVLGILAIGIIALIHEVGHYFFARRAGIKVLELSLGAGPKIFSFEKNGTLYTIRPIPFLAYVRLEENGEGSLGNASIFKRFLLYIGGVFFNILITNINFCIKLRKININPIRFRFIFIILFYNSIFRIFKSIWNIN